MRTQLLIAFLVALVQGPAALANNSLNGFDLSQTDIPVLEIFPGGPQRDGIPSIDEPRFLNPGQARFLKPNSRVLGLHYRGEARAYPVSILNWHEVVNDTISGAEIVVTYCPLCGTGMIFAAPENTDFGVSGLLYNSDVLLYDRQTESLWSQIMMRAVTGPRRGEELRLLPASNTHWAQWQRRYPQTRVLSTDTGTAREYERDPYRGYNISEDLVFPVNHEDKRYHPKELVLGLVHNGKAYAWPLVELSKVAGPVAGHVGQESVNIIFDLEAKTGSVLRSSGDELPTVTAYWFAWVAFHPETRVYTAP